MGPKTTKAKPAFVSHAPQNRTDYTIYIDAPRVAPPRDGFPAVLLMDGDAFFDPGVHAGRTLAQAGIIPHCVVVGVGYGVGFGKPGNFRGRDYTPTHAREEPSSGGAGAFLSYLTDTLWPELAQRYPLRETHRVIAGHSLGSLAVLFALFQEKPFFDRALAGAPSVWWDDRSILGLAAKLRDRTASLPARLYLGVGGDETPSMLGDLELLEAQLRERPFKGLSVSSKVLPGLDHFNSAAEILASGLADLLG